MEMDYLEIMRNMAVEAADEMDPEEVMRLKKIGNDAAVEYVNALNHVNQLLTEGIDADDANATAIAFSEFYSTVVVLLGEDRGVSRDMVMNVFNSGIGSIMNEEP